MIVKMIVMKFCLVEDEKFRSVAAVHLDGWFFLPTPAGSK